MLKSKAIYGIMLALLLAVAIPFSTVVPAEAQPTCIEVINPAVDNNNFIFYISTTKVGDRFNATIWIRDVVNLFAFQIYLTINDALLDITRAWIPRGDVRYVFYGKPELPSPPPTLVDNDGDGSHEAVILGSMLLSGPGVTFTGRKLAAIVEFEILYEPTVQEPVVWDYLNINNSSTYLLDDSLTLIPALMVNGYYEYNYVSPAHDVAIVDFNPYKTVVGQGYSTFINVTVENQGDFTETFNVTVYASTNLVNTTQVTLSNGSAETIKFTWNTSGFAKGNYTINAAADTVPGETDIDDNTYTNGNVTVAMIGDITGQTSNIPDGRVDIRDIAMIAKAYGADLVTDPASPKYGQYWHSTPCSTCPHSPNCDMTGPTTGLPDGKIDIREIARIAKEYGKVDP